MNSHSISYISGKDIKTQHPTTKQIKIGRNYFVHLNHYAGWFWCNKFLRKFSSAWKFDELIPY